MDECLSLFASCIFFSFFLAMSVACRSSQARYQTYITAVITPNPQSTGHKATPCFMYFEALLLGVCVCVYICIYIYIYDYYLFLMNCFFIINHFAITNFYYVIICMKYLIFKITIRCFLHLLCCCFSYFLPFIIIIFFAILGPHLRHMEVPRFPG